LAAAIVLALAPLTSETLKPLLAHSHDHFGWSDVGGASWPSGHSTAAMTLVMCALLVSPRRWRAGVAVLGSIFALAVGFSLLILAWHLPSDVLGGYLVAAFWAALAVAVLRAADARRAPAKGATLAVAAAREGSEIPALVVPALVLAALGAAIAGAALLRPNQVASFASQHHWVVLASLGLASLAALIPTTLASALRR
jgi:hypothetical protein